MRSSLNKKIIFTHLSSAIKKELNTLELFSSISSTNSYLLDKAKQGYLSGSICLAEQQLSGRGRRGKEWQSPNTGNVYLSLLWHFPKVMMLSNLSLVVGLGILRSLIRFGLQEKSLGVKWPNDIYYDDRKLAGILIETCPLLTNKLAVVIGVGINISLSSEIENSIDQPVIDLSSILLEKVNRDQLVAIVIEELFLALNQFTDSGFDLFNREWNKYDLALNREVLIKTHGQSQKGIGRGVNEQGELLIDYLDGKVKAVSSGDISLRLVK